MSLVTKAARKSLIWLAAIFVTIYGVLAAGVATGNTAFTPELALDLAGGRQIILSPVLEEGADQTVDQSDLDQAVEIIRQRIDATGVAESEISTQGNNIVVALPGNPSDATVDLVAQAAQLQYRPVLLVGDPGVATLPEDGEPSPAPEDGDDAAPTPTPEATASPAATAEPTPSPEASEVAHVVGADAPATSPEPTEDPLSEPTPEPVDPDEIPAGNPTTPNRDDVDSSSFEWLTDDLLEEYAALDCTDPLNRAGRTMGNLHTGHVACDDQGFAKFVLGPVELQGNDLQTASAGPAVNQFGTLTGGYEVRMELRSSGAATIQVPADASLSAAARFDQLSQRLVDLEEPRNQFAVVLDGVVITAPRMNQRISDGTASITGNFTQETAEQLANQLRFGALPISLEMQSNQQISATLGADQLQRGLLAGAIGMVLVFLYALYQYRALGLVVIGSLLVAGGLTFGLISLLSWGLDYRLSLAGVAGLIIAVGITADSFIVFFERLRDELRDGRSLQAAIDHGWKRARRTIIASDVVSLLAAVTLYSVAVGGVRGFAFTLGLTTVIDAIMVIMFTHPLMVFLARTKFFGEGHKWSGLDPRQLGRESIYKGRGRVRTPRPAAVAVASGEPTLTLAERKAAERKAASVEKPADASADTTDSESEGGR